MIPIAVGKASELVHVDQMATKMIHKRICAPTSDKLINEKVTISPLTGALLCDLSEVCLENFAVDPLSIFDTPVALISEDIPKVYCDPQSGVICLSESF